MEIIGPNHFQVIKLFKFSFQFHCGGFCFPVVFLFVPAQQLLQCENLYILIGFWNHIKFIFTFYPEPSS